MPINGGYGTVKRPKFSKASSNPRNEAQKNIGTQLGQSSRPPVKIHKPAVSGKAKTKFI